MNKDSVPSLIYGLSHAKFVSSLDEAVEYMLAAMPGWGQKEMASLVARHAASVSFPCLLGFDEEIGVPVFVPSYQVHKLMDTLIGIMPGDPVAKAMQVSGRRHATQVDKGGNAYSFHALAVAAIVLAEGGSTEQVAAALCHDVVEDTECSFEDLRSLVGLSDSIVDMVDSMTKRPSESADQYICRLKKNKNAILLKRADILHNMDLDRLNREPGAADRERNKSYQDRLKSLEEG